MRVRVVRSAIVLACSVLSAVWATKGIAQSTVRGRVVASDSTNAPIAGVQLSFPRLGIGLVTDSVGRFVARLESQGTYALVARAVGFRPETIFVQADVDAVELSDVRLVKLPQVLGEVLVEGESESIVSRMSGFEDRRKMGIGTFIDRATLDKFSHMRTGNLLRSRVPGLFVVQGPAGRAWATSTRSVSGPGGALKAGRCYLDVYLNGAMVYNSKSQMPLFDLNSVMPEQLESVEVYVGTSQIPAQFNKTGGGCGVMVIWMR